MFDQLKGFLYDSTILQVIHLQKLSLSLSEKPPLGTKDCQCSIPCNRPIFEASLSSSLLDMYKIKHEIMNNPSFQYLLPKHQDALEISAQVSQRSSM